MDIRAPRAGDAAVARWSRSLLLALFPLVGDEFYLDLVDQDDDPRDLRAEPRTAGRRHRARVASATRRSSASPPTRRACCRRKYGAAASGWLLPAAIAAAALLRSSSARLSLRTRGVYFIMVTLAFAQMAYFVFHDTKLGGGSDGIYLYVKPVLAIGGVTLVDLGKPRRTSTTSCSLRWC